MQDGQYAQEECKYLWCLIHHFGTNREQTQNKLVLGQILKTRLQAVESINTGL